MIFSKIVLLSVALGKNVEQEQHLINHIYQGYDLTDINELMSFLADCSIKALNDLYKGKF